MNTHETLLRQGKSLPVLDSRLGEQYEEEYKKVEQRSAGYKEDFERAWAKAIPEEEFFKQMHEWLDEWPWEAIAEKARNSNPEEAEQEWAEYLRSKEFQQQWDKKEKVRWGKK
jgi:hypothetical protein